VAKNYTAIAYASLNDINEKIPHPIEKEEHHETPARIDDSSFRTNFYY
jgi:hypothetical protein